MRLNTTRPDRKTAQTSATFGYQAPVKWVEDADTGERVGWIRPCEFGIEWSSQSQRGCESTEAEALEAMKVAVLEYRANEAADAAYVAEVMALPEPARTARRERDRAAVRVEIERQRNVIRPHDLELAQARLLIAEAELADATAAIGRSARRLNHTTRTRPMDARTRHETRSLIEIDANSIDRSIYHLAAQIDQFCEMVSRGKPKMDPALIEAARSVASARSAIRKHMHKNDLAGTVG